ncbi:MAG: MgtC/SapB family protein [Gemmatimonadaceae bacterium]
MTFSPMQTAHAMVEAFRLVVLAKLLLATLVGGAIGIEREIAGKPAGLRTNVLICIGSAFFTLVSVELAGPGGDPTRIIGQIVTGIGFLGAGAILHGGGSVNGLTTAATVWVVAAIGVAVGVGAYIEALGATILVMAVLVGLRPLELRLQAKRHRLHAVLRVKPGVVFDAFEKLLVEGGVHVYARRTFEHDTDRTFDLDLIGSTLQLDAIVDRIKHQTDVVSITTD